MKWLVLLFIFVAPSAFAFDLSGVEIREIPVDENEDAHSDLLDLTLLPLPTLNMLPQLEFERAIASAILRLPARLRPAFNPAVACRERFGPEFRYGGIVRSGSRKGMRASHMCVRNGPTREERFNRLFSDFAGSIEAIEQASGTRRCRLRPNR